MGAEKSILVYVELKMPVVYPGGNDQRPLDIEVWGRARVRPGGRELGNISMKVEKAMAPHSSTLAWKIPWTEEPGRLQSMGSLRVGHD